MIDAKDADNISRLLKQLSRDSSTENTIAFMADNSGMLQASKRILFLCRAGRQESIQWLQKECGDHGVLYPWFLQELAQILQLFQSDDAKEDSYGVLGLSSSASLADVKSAYRKLTIQYHPDTAGNTDQKSTEKFIHINKAYHAITNSQNQESADDTSAGTTYTWRYGKIKNAGRRVNSKTIGWISGLILLSVLSCVLFAQLYSQKVMLSTLQHSGAAFVPPAKKSQGAPVVVAMTFAEKMRITEIEEKAQQAARQKESEADHAKRAESVEAPELTAVQADILPAELEEKVSQPPQEPVEVIPSLSELSSQKTNAAEKVKNTTDFQDTETKAEKAKVKTRPEDGDAEKNRVQTVKDATSQGFMKKVASEIPEPVVERRDRHDEPISIVPTQDAAKVELAVQAVVEPPQLPKIPEEEFRSEPDLQQRIDTFLSEYCRTYGDKNLIKFTRFFELDATENGKPISELMGTYTDLFEATKTIGLKISTLKWEESSKGEIVLNGRFKIDLVYQNEEVVHGRGKIDFLLVADHGNMHVKKMSYSFDQ